MALFSLRPLGPEANEVCQSCDPAFHDSYNGSGVLTFGHRPSLAPGRIASFGRDPGNDIQLPCAGPGSTGNPNNYRGTHFFFYYAPSGELILRDMTPRLTEIEVYDVSPEDEAKYALQGSPRVRVIPRSNLKMAIIFGKCTRFEFIWRVAASPQVQDAMAQRAAAFHVPGIFFTSAGRDETDLEPSGRILRSRYAPTCVPTRRNIQFHRYDELGRGTFGVVSKVVELATGQLWAVKELKSTAWDDRWRNSFLGELETVQPLRHQNIVHLEHFQDFCIGGRFQIFYRLYRGSVQKILPPHRCLTRPSGVPPWAPRFVDHVLAGLEFLHDNSILHRDIKPENILFDFEDGSDQPSFYITDFGLSIQSAAAACAMAAQGAAGSAFYMAPETSEGNPQTVSDIWSFAVTLGCVFGFWCCREYSASAAEWGAKLQVLGYSGRYTEREPDSVRDEYVRWAKRLDMLTRGGALPPVYKRLIVRDRCRMNAKECLAVGWNESWYGPAR